MAPPSKSGPSNPNGHIVLIRGVLVLMMLQTTILIAGIPWAFRIHGDVRSLAAHMEFMIPGAKLASQKDYMNLLSRVVANEVRIQDLKNHDQNTGDPFDAIPNRD